jgi:predicted nucleic acid-binding protein
MGADLIVTGDQAMLELGSFEGIQITSLRAYLEA